MAVSTKTLTPTNQVVSIPDMTEKPNASVLSDGIAKEADAINELDRNIKSFDTKISYATAFDAPVDTHASALHFYADRIGRSIYYDVVFVLTSAVTANTKIAHVTNLSNGTNVHVSAVGSNGSPGRFLINPNGDVMCENNLKAGEYFSFSAVSLYNASIT